MLTKERIKQIKAVANKLDPVVRIGKNGFTKGMEEEVKKQLKKNKVIKIKMLKAFLEGKDKKAAGREIADKADAELIQQTGFVIILARKSI